MKISPVQSDYKDVINLLFKIVFMVQCQVSVQRINKFMNSDELDPHSVTHDQEIEDPVVVRNATFTWGEDVKTSISRKNIHKIMIENLYRKHQQPL